MYGLTYIWGHPRTFLNHCRFTSANYSTLSKKIKDASIVFGNVERIRDVLLPTLKTAAAVYGVPFDTPFDEISIGDSHWHSPSL
jgi:hypothetical protein